jgi:hypothetical protein
LHGEIGLQGNMTTDENSDNNVTGRATQTPTMNTEQKLKSHKILGNGYALKIR